MGILVITAFVLSIPTAIRLFEKSETIFTLFIIVLVAVSVVGFLGIGCKLLRVIMVIFCILIVLSLALDVTVLSVNICSWDNISTVGNDSDNGDDGADGADGDDEDEHETYNSTLYIGKPGAILEYNEQDELTCCLFGDTSRITGKWIETVESECCTNVKTGGTKVSSVCKLKNYGQYEFRCSLPKYMGMMLQQQKRDCKLWKPNDCLKLIVDLLMLILAIAFLLKTWKAK
ncbi:hypothetical protein HHI36_013790 [Cryptolaemus montrouzieri]|uniref:Uncharacterized protein n=1 Tax=Cryptolaemus montrouzieri TaxID=559131 RepID=A0ABD2NJG5_9CUCU